MKDLHAADLLLEPDGTTIAVASVLATGQTATVYNFEVEGLHNYYVKVGSHLVLVHNACGTAAAKSGEEAVSLFKASQPGLGKIHIADGYKAADFPGNGAYFARDRSIAESYATHYGEGVIEIRTPADVYARHFAEHEMKYQGTPSGTELAIPGEKLDLLSQFPRFWHGAP